MKEQSLLLAIAAASVLTLFIDLEGDLAAAYELKVAQLQSQYQIQLDTQLAQAYQAFEAQKAYYLSQLQLQQTQFGQDFEQVETEKAQLRQEWEALHQWAESIDQQMMQKPPVL